MFSVPTVIRDRDPGDECGGACCQTKDEWLFTVGLADGRFYIRIAGSFDDARQQMFDLCGSRWSSQYHASEADDLKRLGYRELVLV